MIKLSRIVSFLSLFILMIYSPATANTTLIKIGLVGHDHQVGALIPLLESNAVKKKYNIYLVPVKEGQFYDFFEGNRKIGQIQLIKGSSCSNVCQMIADESLDIGIAGIGPIAFMADKGKGLKCVSPLQQNGNLIVVHPSVEVENWSKFVDWVKNRQEQVRFGYRSPTEVANLIVQDALRIEGIPFTFDKSDQEAKVRFVNMKGDKFAVPSLANKIVDVYAGPTPYAQVVVKKKIGKKIAYVHDLPPGHWTGHPCCAVGASSKFIEERPDLVQKYLSLLLIGTQMANENPDLAAKVASKWKSISEDIEKESLKSVELSLEPDENFRNGTYKWFRIMQRQGRINGKLANADQQQFESEVYDFRCLEKAMANMDAYLR